MGRLGSPKLDLGAQFGTFLDIMSNPKSTTTPPSPVGAGYQQSLEDYWQKYQQGKGGDLSAGLAGVAKDVDNSLALVSGP